MKPLEPPDSTHLVAAQGWFDLGNHHEANEELEKITAELRVHPDVLEMRWRIYAKAQNWDACVHVADAITRLAPDRASGWIMKSIVLHGQGRVQQAWDTLLPAADRWPQVPVDDRPTEDSRLSAELSSVEPEGENPRVRATRSTAQRPLSSLQEHS